MEASSTSWLLKIEAVNFGSVLFDVDDLSAIRGGGEAMLAAPQFILNELTKKTGTATKIELIYAAASHVLARFSGTEQDVGTIGVALDSIVSSFCAAKAAAALESAADAKQMLDHLLPHLVPQLSFAWGMVSEDDGLVALETAVRQSQMRRLSIDVPPVWSAGAVSTDRPCAHDSLRPRAVKGIMPDGNCHDLSFSMALRRSLGRTGRRAEFFGRILGEKRKLPPVGYAHDFSELVENPPEGVPEQIAGKIVHVSFDANAMGALRDALATDPASAKLFAQNVLDKRATFLHALIHWAFDQDHMKLACPKRKQIDGKDRALPILRFEMLAWGADEMCFVLPAWALEPFLIKLAELLAIDKWTLGEDAHSKTITHGIGFVIASAKAPIRLLKSLADQLADDCKTVSRKINMLQYWAVGSIDMPTRGLEGERAALFGISTGDNQSTAFTLPLEHVAAGFDLLRAIKGVSGDKAIGIPRQKLIALCSAPEGLKGLLDKGGYRDGEGKLITIENIISNLFFKASADQGENGIRFRHMLELWPYAGLLESSKSA